MVADRTRCPGKVHVANGDQVLHVARPPVGVAAHAAGTYHGHVDFIIGRLARPRDGEERKRACAGRGGGFQKVAS